MSAFTDKLEINLKRKAQILEKIYESDHRFADGFDASLSEADQYDDYMDAQNSYMNELDELDVEYDRIFEYLSTHPGEAQTADQAQKNRINMLIQEINGKIQAVNSIETRARALTDEYFKKRHSDISTSRKTVRIIQNHYRPVSTGNSSEDSIFDISN